MGEVPWIVLVSRMLILGLFVGVPLLLEVKGAKSDWNLWKKANGVDYIEENVDNERRDIWENNKQRIEDNNSKYFKGKSKFTMAMNKFGDLSTLEYQHLLGTKVNANSRKKEKTYNANKLRYIARNLRQTTVDYRQLGYITKVKEQGYCGACWAFSSTGAIEGQMFKKTGQLVSLSEQNLLDCSSSYGTYGCNGGLMSSAFDYVIHNGLLDSQTYPYTSMETQPCFYDSNKTVARISDYRFVPAGDEQALADTLTTVGPISIAVDANHASFMFYSSGIYDEPMCDPSSLSHAMLLVGYGLEGGNNYWILKNSWGTSWGEGGYMRMVRNGNNTCGIASYAVYPIA